MPTLNGNSLDILEENIKNLRQLFPEVECDGKIDFDMLRQILGEYVDDDKERYNFKWNGKGRALRFSQTPSTGTLRPCKEESKDWDDTQNLYIEGDNLEVLKILQKSYHGKIKMIYIDPPYNTGKDFVYPDNYHDSLENYKAITGQTDEEGRKISTNTEASGRFHTDWLNMMYPRLRLARNLLTDDGVIFISIDEIEMTNMRKICDEIIGEDNHIADFVWHNKRGGGNDSKFIAVEHEYVLMYAKNKTNLGELFVPYSPEYLTRYKEEDEIGKYFWDTFKRKSGKQYYAINCPDGTVLDKDEFGNPISWLRSEARFYEDLSNGEVRIVKNNNYWSVQFKQRMPIGKKPRTIFLEESILENQGTTGDGSSEVLTLFLKNLFENPKPIKLVEHLVNFNTNNNDIILDFFSGSATTAHAVMQLNAEDGGNRRFICVQLPEPTSDSSEAFKAGYKNICEIGKERIRRAGEKIKNEIESGNGQIKLDEEPKEVPDIGFKVFKLDSSNLKKWNPDFDNLELSLDDMINNYVPDRTEEDVVYEFMLKMGLDLSYPVDVTEIDGKKIYSIGFGALMMCLDDNITVSVAEGMVKMYKELAPETWKVIFKDEGFADDCTKTNIKLTLIQAGLEEDAFTTV